MDIVLAIPRGGLPLGREVADALAVPLDIVVASKIGAPGNPEYAIGAVASDGTVWRNEEAISQSRATDEYFEAERSKEAENAREKAQRYRGGDPEPDITDKDVAIVDDGVATGSTLRASLAMLRKRDPGRLLVAVPVGPPETIETLEELADDVLCLVTPRHFRGVGAFYEEFDQVSDSEAMTYLERPD